MSEVVEAFVSFGSSPAAIMMMILGTTLGITVGVMPGLTGAMLIALSLPLTFSMSGESALVLLVSMYVGSVSGGLVTATLLKIPGTPASMMTTFDGYPMASAGEADRALGLGIFSSLVGGVIGWIFLVLLSAPLARLSLQLGPFEYFSLVLVALVLIASVGGKSLFKGLLSGSLGLLLAVPGVDPASGNPRWTFGLTELEDGFKLLPVLIGLFAISQVIVEVGKHETAIRQPVSKTGSLFMRMSECLSHPFNLVRSSLIGVFIGILPGIGANIGSVVSYSAAKGLSRTPERFGNGSEEGIIASEAANNATVGGALIPLIAMGIPGSVIDAILLGALTIHGLQPGPMLMQSSPDIVSMIMVTMLAANLFMFVFMLITVRWLVRLASIPHTVLLPAILVLCVVGSYALANRMFDVWVMLGMGAVGLWMNHSKLPIAPFIIGFVLAPIAESQITEGLMQSGGNWLPLVERPVSLLLIVTALVILGFGLRQNFKSNSTRRTQEQQE